MRYFFVLISVVFCNYWITAQTTLHVNPDVPNSPTADGSLANPYNDIATTVELVATAGGGEVIVIDGEYEMTGKEVTISTVATAATAVTIKPQSTAGVKFNFNGRFGFEFDNDARYITLEGFELHGETDEIDYWSIVAQAFWGDPSILQNGGLAVILDGQYITIKDNYIHDWYQKAIEIRDGRYIVVEGNIIHNIATTSLSGGHGIMRQQKGQEFFTNDVPGVYRWDISENMIFAVEQRIYSWVPSKGFIEMVIDEGKSILIDDPKDTDGVQEDMTARIKNNVIAFGAVDHIRLKSTPNLEVSHNSIYAEGPNADGITDKQGDTNTPQFTNFICHNNAAQTVAGISAIEIDKAVQQTTSAGGTPNVSGNYAMDGKVKPTGQSGITQLTNGQLFVNPHGGDFSINPALNLPASTGVMPSVLNDMNQKTIDFGVVVGADNFEIDHLKLTQTILDNVPGLNDGIVGNETVFADYGTMSSNYHTIEFNVVSGTWKTDTGSPNKQDFELNEVYYTWYESIAINYLNNSGLEYERIRWGDSEVKQNQVFDADWLTVSQITSTSNTVINGDDNDFILDGDILIDFENFTPQIGDEFDLITANTITTNNTGSLFDIVLFEGYTPANYSLTIVNVSGMQAVRLTILATLPVELAAFEARKKGQFVQLDWRTMTEENNDFFSIERSSKGVEWEKIGHVNGQGNSIKMVDYSFFDKNPFVGDNYYRLKQQDINGTFTYSQIKVVTFTKGTIEISPNPAKDWFVLTTDTQLHEIHLFDGQGREVTRQCIIEQVSNGYHFLTKELGPGVYFLKVDKETIRVVIK